MLKTVSSGILWLHRPMPYHDRTTDATRIRHFNPRPKRPRQTWQVRVRHARLLRSFQCVMESAHRTLMLVCYGRTAARDRDRRLEEWARGNVL